MRLIGAPPEHRGIPSRHPVVYHVYGVRCDAPLRKAAGVLSKRRNFFFFLLKRTAERYSNASRLGTIRKEENRECPRQTGFATGILYFPVFERAPVCRTLIFLLAKWRRICCASEEKLASFPRVLGRPKLSTRLSACNCSLFSSLPSIRVRDCVRKRWSYQSHSRQHGWRLEREQKKGDKRPKLTVRSPTRTREGFIRRLRQTMGEKIWVRMRDVSEGR